MFFVSLTRIIKFTWQHFWRNIWLSIATMIIIMLTLFSLTTLVLVNVVAEYATESVRDTVDVSLYFSNETSEEAIQLLKTELEKIEEIKTIRYVSPDEALEQFKKDHEGNEDIIGSLSELDTNPMGGTLVIAAWQVEQYPVIMEKIKEIKADELAEKIDYEDHRLLIGRINDFTNKIKTFGLAISSIFLLVAVLTVFNTIRMGIYIHRKEIGIMRLVGANNWYIRLPFVAEGLLYAFFSCLLFFLTVVLLVHFFGPRVNEFFSGINFDLIGYLKNNAVNILGFEFILLALVNMFSALVAMGRYLKV